MRAFIILLFCMSCGSAAWGRTLTLADILSVDPLGYECIASEHLLEENPTQASLAFQVGGKIKLPRTCLPDPCDAALERHELASLTGTDPSTFRFGREWDDYYARYADYCRKEIPPEPNTPVVARSDEDFWNNTITMPREGTIRTVTTGTSGVSEIILTGSRQRITSTSDEGVPTITTTTTTFFDDDDPEDVIDVVLGDDDTVPLSVVPTPSSGILAATSFGFVLLSLMMLSKRKI